MHNLYTTTPHINFRMADQLFVAVLIEFWVDLILFLLFSNHGRRNREADGPDKNTRLAPAESIRLAVICATL